MWFRFFLVFLFFQIGLYVRGTTVWQNFDSAKQKILQDDIRRLIIDTDAGSDDAVGILNLLGAEDLFHKVETVFITAVHGNTHVDNVGRNLLKILSIAERLDIPVYKGMNQSILSTPQITNFFGNDGLGDFDFPNPPKEELIKHEHAVNALVKSASLHPGTFTLVCLGPLSNIAMAIKMDSNFLRNLKEIFVLGGSDSGLGNVKPGIEFNFYVDSEAAFIVFNEAKKWKKVLHLVSWETVISRNPIDMSWRIYVLGSLKSPQIDFINKAEKLNLNEENKIIWASADTVLTSVVIDDNIVEIANNFHVDVEVCGQFSRGSIFVDYENSEKLFKNVRLIKKINVIQFKNMLIQNLNPRGGQTSGAAL